MKRQTRVTKKYINTSVKYRKDKSLCVTAEGIIQSHLKYAKKNKKSEKYSLLMKD